MILAHIWDRLKLKKEEWKKIYKGLCLLLLILKAGDPACYSSIKGRWYAIHALQNIHYKSTPGKWNVKEKAKEICDLIDNERMLQEERESIRVVRDKLFGRCNV